ncbi:MAG TPA: DUF4430 domain-containing protein [Candidatus Egerieimonas intestinavium]|uniref:DUF4430 domain-containing protein n=1 Tax=Candidatus Egerieimonas intestinavium TaxID=2840777 RepID=A0A9D1EI94_9FIRM|nr:DUF4430 domain-containing protein [Candidatus Egerieimonas intestinavium]
MKKKGIIAAAALLVLVCLGAGLLYMKFRPKTSQGEKEIQVTVIHGDGQEKVLDYRTDLEYLGQVLVEDELIQGQEGQYGLFIETVDQETADSSRQQWWCITKGGEQVNTSVDSTPIQDGDHFELTLKEGY